jgi:hypothetical protein
VQEDCTEEDEEGVVVTDARAEPVVVQAPRKGTASQRLLCPFDLQVWAIDRMLNLEITNDPDYEGLELQVFDDPAHGTGMIVLLKRRRDGRFDIYRQPGLTLDPEIAQVGGELGEWLETSIDPARFDISPVGIDVDVRIADLAGRVIHVRIDDRDGRRRHRGTLLAPVGSLIEHPVSLPLFLMGGCDLVRKTGRAFDVSIDGRQVTTGRLPGGWLHRRQLVKYTADPTVVLCNRARTGPVFTVDPRAPGTVELAPLSTGIVGMQAHGGGHAARLELEPALPDLAQLRPGAPVEGTWRLGIDGDTAVVGGLWAAERRRDCVDLVVDVTRGWTPKRLPLLMAAVTRVAPVFRTWPASYRWTATVQLGDQPTMTSRWERKGHQRDQSYRRLTTERSAR